ncbi:hypothetical protein BJX96DRAFT_184778 [Aspergillus floccosus]
MPPPYPSTSSRSQIPPAGRTSHACAECRHRKQKCGGFTSEIKCRPCIARRVQCSFQEEIKDFRHNPYIRVRSPRSASPGEDRETVDAILPGISSATVDLSPAALEGGSILIVDIEKQLVPGQNGPNDYPNTPRSQAATSSLHCLEPSLSHTNYRDGVLSPKAVNTDGPLKALGSLQTDDPVEVENLDPIKRSILTEGEAYVIFKLYFTRCHPNAPFLDVGLDADIDRVRSNNMILFLAILCIGARFWSASSNTSCWLHPRYLDLIRLLDTEVMRVTLRPSHDDQKLETVQALMLCAHWMPFDFAAEPERYRSRFSEDGACQPFMHLQTVAPDDMRRFRTMLYLVESDHYLALSARRPPSLNPDPLNAVLPNFLACRYAQSTDIRIASLFRVAYVAHFTGCRPTTVESVQALDRDVLLIERDFISRLGSRSMEDSFNHHFPFTSLRWYRLSYACAFLDVADQMQRTGEAFTWAVEWASQILSHLSRPPLSSQGLRQETAIASPLEPDPRTVEVMSFAMDHYYVVIAYAAFFLVNSWLNNLVDRKYNSPGTAKTTDATGSESPSSCPTTGGAVAADTLEIASPPVGHPARRYVPLLRGMTNLILSGHMQPPRDNGPSGATGEDLWEMWQQAGLEPMIWPSVLDRL